MAGDGTGNQLLAGTPVLGTTVPGDVTLAPGSLLRNVVAPAGDVSSLRLRRNTAGQTSAVQTWETEGGAVLGSVGPTGAVTVYGGGTAPTAGAWTTLKSGGDAEALAIYDVNNFQMVAFPAVLSRKGTLRLFAPAAQASGVGMDFTASADGASKTGLFQLDNSGNMIFRQNTAGSMYFDFINAINFRNGSFATLATLSSTGGMVVTPAAATTGLILQGAAAQTASLLSCQESNGGALVNVLPAGDVEFRRTSSTTPGRLTAWIQSTFAVSTDASRTGRGLLYASDFTPADRECLRWETSGTAPMLGFLGATSVVRQAGASAAGIAAIADASAKAAVSALQTALANLGLITSPA